MILLVAYIWHGYVWVFSQLDWLDRRRKSCNPILGASVTSGAPTQPVSANSNTQVMLTRTHV